MKKINLDELAKAKQRAYLREWRTKNRDKVKKHNEDYWKNRALKELTREEKEKNPRYY